MDVAVVPGLISEGRFMTPPKMREHIPLRGTLAENDRLREECRRLTSENKALLQVIDTLLADNSDLRESALMWISLYERQLERANRAIARLGGIEDEPGASD
jgi:hypothetical protein